MIKIKSLHIFILHLTFLIFVSCKAQNNGPQSQSETLSAANQQLNQLVGVWVPLNTSHTIIDTLNLYNSGDYLIRGEENEIRGKWKLNDVLHMSLDHNNYRFYFKGKFLVLTDEKGNKYEFANKSIATEKYDSSEGTDGQISEFVRRIFQDRLGDLWFGTNGDGVVRYDGKSLDYFNYNNGFSGDATRGIVEDGEGNVWFGTNRGLIKYDPSIKNKKGAELFSHYTSKDGLIQDDIWSLEVDSKGILWIGTLQGLCRFDGTVFTPFDLPKTEPDPNRGVSSARIVNSIMEDSKGRMWFGTPGGAFIYDAIAEKKGGQKLTKISKEDGLCGNSINCILEDKGGNIWFATHYNGVCRWDANMVEKNEKTFTHFNEKDGVEGIEAWNLYEDTGGNIWFPIENSGVYRYGPPNILESDNKSRYQANSVFTNYTKKDGLQSNAIQCTFEDDQGRLWFGGYLGLFRCDLSVEKNGEDVFYSVSKSGPWF